MALDTRTSIWDRLVAPWRQTLSPPTEPAVKAATGAGAVVLENPHQTVWTGTNNPSKFMKEAQAVSHSNPWVATAERIISGKFATVGWHLEDAQENEVPITSGLPAIINTLIERPNPRMTRRVLWQITSRHLGVCGNAFWFLDQRDGLNGAPLSIYYINPARMTPVTDANGNLTAWAMQRNLDWNDDAAIRLELDEVLHFVLEPPDWGFLGHGLVEAAMSKISISRYADRFAADNFASGGRKGGFIGPKQDRMPDEVFESLTASMRNIAEIPDAHKRNVVTKGPIDFQPQGSTSEEMGLAEMMAGARDDILAVWGVPPSQAGVPTAGGLNSGERSKYEEAALWQGSIHTRVMAFWEVVQYQLLDRFGGNLNLVIEEPSFDDQEPLFKLAEMAKDLPLTVKERRELVGYEPFDDERDDEVFLPAVLVKVYPEEEPEPTPPQLVASAPPPLLEPGEEEEPPGKAKTSPLGSLRTAIERSKVPAIRKAAASVLASQKADVLRRLKDKAGHLVSKPGDIDVIWRSAARAKDWDALRPQLAGIVSTVATEARIALKPGKADDDFLDRVSRFVFGRSGDRITGINDTTRDALLATVRDVVAEGTDQGLGPSEIADRLTDAVDGMTIWNDERAERIARTETMFAYNDAALQSYAEFGVEKVEALDGDYDEECAARNGQVFSLEEALAIEDHPNGTLDWAPA
jgi:HK97 family phage portal protein